MENNESLLQELEEFNKEGDGDKPISANLENFIENVSKTGTNLFPWSKIRKVYLQKLRNVLNMLSSSTSPITSTSTDLNSSSLQAFIQNSNFNDSNNVDLIKARLIERMTSFTSAPFTIQRISELLLKPSNYYTREDKFLRGLEKCIMVVTTIDPFGNKILIENNDVPIDDASTEKSESSRPENMEVSENEIGKASQAVA